MKNKILFISALIVSIGIGGVLWATDQIASTPNGALGDATKFMTANRTSLTRVATTTTSLTSVTNLITAAPGAVYKLVWVTGSQASQLEIHNATATTGATAANEVYYASTNTAVIGLPTVIDLSSTSGGHNCSSGIVTVLKPGNTASVDRVYIQFDNAR